MKMLRLNFYKRTLLAMMFIFIGNAFAEDCKYDYRIQYDQDGKVKDIKTETLSVSGASSSFQASGEKSAVDNSNDKIKVYSLPNCPACKKAKAYLSAKGVDYDDIDVSTSDKALKEMMDISGQTRVPVIIIQDKFMVGFDSKRIDELLGIK